MKRWNAIGILTVLATGMVFMSGCISPVSTGTIPEATLPPQVDYETVPVPPAPTPTTAVPASTAPVAPPPQIVNETVPVTTLAPTPALTTVNDHGYDESKYKDTDPEPPVSVEDNATGGLFINIRAGGATEGLKVFIARDGTNVSPVEYSYLPDRTIVEGQNSGYIQVKILPDGRSELVKLMPGKYIAYLPDMNGGEPEQQSFMISKGGITPLWFTGFAASSGSGGCGC